MTHTGRELRLSPPAVPVRTDFALHLVELVEGDVSLNTVGDHQGVGGDGHFVRAAQRG